MKSSLAHTFGDTGGHHGEGQRQGFAQEAAERAAVEERVIGGGELAVKDVVAGGFKDHIMHRHADVGRGLLAMEHLIGGGVGAHDAAEDTERGMQFVEPAGRKLAEEIAECGIHIGFVEGDPVGHQISEGTHRALGVVAEELWRLRIEKAAARLKPAGMGEVMEGDENPHAATASFANDLAVADDGGVTPMSECRLHAAPLQRNANGVEPEMGAEIEVAGGIEPPIAGVAADRAGTDASGTLPVIPLVQGVASLELVRRGGYTPKEIAGKRNGDREHRRYRSNSDARLAQSARTGWARGRFPSAK